MTGINQRIADVHVNKVHGPLVNINCSVVNENIILGTNTSDDRKPDSLIEGSIERYGKVEINKNTVHDCASRREANVDETESVVDTLGTCLNERRIEMCKPSLDAEEYISDINTSNVSEVLNNYMEMCIPDQEYVLVDDIRRSTDHNSYMDDIVQINTNETVSYMKQIHEHTSEIDAGVHFNICLNEHNPKLNVDDAGIETNYIHTDFNKTDITDTAAADYTLQHVSDASPCSQTYAAGNIIEELISWTGEPTLLDGDIADDVSLMSKPHLQQQYEAGIGELNKCDTYDENNNGYCLIEIYIIDSIETEAVETEAANSKDQVYVLDNNKAETNNTRDELFNVDINSVNRQKHNYASDMIGGIRDKLVNCDATSMSVCGPAQYRDTAVETIVANDEQCRQEDGELCGMDETTFTGNYEELQLDSSIHGKYFATRPLANILPVPDTSVNCCGQTGNIDELETQEQGHSKISRHMSRNRRGRVNKKMKVLRTKLPDPNNLHAIKSVSNDSQAPGCSTIRSELFKEQDDIQMISYSAISPEFNTEHGNIQIATDSTMAQDLFNKHGEFQAIGGYSALQPELYRESSRISKRHSKMTRYNNTDKTKVEYDNSNDKNVKKKVKHTLPGSENGHYKVGKGKRRKRKTDVCTQIVEDPRSRATLLRNMKSGKYGDQPRVIRVTEDGTILDVTYEYRQSLPY